MNYYVDVFILANPELLDHILMCELLQRLHNALVDLGNGEIGVSFPRFNTNLGNHLRLHGNLHILQRLMSFDWIGTVQDHVKTTSIHPIPQKVEYRNIRRVQCKSSIERLMRRSVKKGWLTKEEADEKIENSKDCVLNLPYVKLRSHSTKQLFRLFIGHGPILSESVPGSFSTYGLSSQATVPWF